MGTAVQYLPVESYKPVLSGKDPHQRKDRPDGYRMAACVDGSKKSLNALKMICDMRSGNDRISVITCEQPNIDTQKVKDIVCHLLEERGCLEYGEVNILKSEAGRKTADIIRDHLTSTEKYIDIVLVGNQGADFSTNDKSKYLGSVANQIIRHTKLNALFIP